jgi:anti-sigma regulatory factor (Ser/Thr protein kinase)
VSLSAFGFGPGRDRGSRAGAETGALRLPGPLVDEIGWFDVCDAATATNAIQVAARAGQRAGLGDARIAELSHAVSGLCDQLYRHAVGGRLAVRCLRRAGTTGVEVVAVDAGPGRSDLGGPGTLVGTASREDGSSLPGRGTTIVAQFWPRGVYPGACPVAGLTRPLAGEPVSGDRFAVRSYPDGTLVLVADGLGHGPLAAEAATAAVDAFRTTPVDEPAEVVEHIHQAITHTRGAAVAVVRLAGADGAVRFAGHGNNAAAVLAAPGTAGAARQGMVSQPGVAGHQRRTVCEFSYPVEPGAMVVLHSDGVTDRWDLAAYPGLARHEPLVIAATSCDAVRRDDACVVVASIG